MSQRRFATIVLITAIAVHVLGVWALPRLIMGRVMDVLGRGAEVNEIFHAPRSTARHRVVVRPSPDLAYSVCLFDLSQGPLRITAPVGPGYMSVSGFAANTVNFFVVNDLEVRPAPVDVLLMGPGRASAPPAGVRAIESPSERGLVLMRRVIDSEATFPELDRVRQQARCESVRQ